MAHSPALTRHDQKLRHYASETPVSEDDERWRLAQRVAASRQFVRSPLLSRFLLHIVAETVGGRADQITEHQIGVHVFDRPSTYRTVEDNIVRNYARQLRRRLAEYFADDGLEEALQISIPLGGYVPQFTPLVSDKTELQAGKTPVSIRSQESGRVSPPDIQTAAGSHSRSISRVLWLGLCATLLIAMSWYLGWRFGRQHPTDVVKNAASPLWASVFARTRNTYIVPADAGLNLLEDLSRQPLTLADYIAGSYANLKLPAMDPHSRGDLTTQRFTSFVDLQIVSALSRLPEYNPERTILRFPRDLRVDDLRNANAIIIGSVGSNPWAAVAQASANFRIVYPDGMQEAMIVDAKPRNGEQAEYVSHWDEPAHQTYALISCLPNLDGSGRLLFLQGLDVAGTQAAAEALLHPAAIAPILHRAERRDGSLGYFEILLRTTSLESSAIRTEVVGSRVY